MQVWRQGAWGAHLAVCTVNGIVCVPGVIKLDKAKATRAASLDVVDDLRGSRASQGVVRRQETQRPLDAHGTAP